MRRLARRTPFTRNLAALLLCTSMLSFAAFVTAAQSGRRAPQPASPAPPPPTPTPEPAPAKKKPAAPTLPLIVVGYSSMSMSIPMGYPEYMLDIVARRLSESSAIMATKGKDMNRKGAIDLAKGEKEAHVVWLELQETGEYSSSSNASDNLRISYTVFFPETGKTKTQGNVYLRDARSVMGQRIGRVPPCYPSSAFDYQLVLAGIQVADHIMDSFNLPIPSVCQ